VAFFFFRCPGGAIFLSFFVGGQGGGGGGGWVQPLAILCTPFNTAFGWMLQIFCSAEILTRRKDQGCGDCRGSAVVRSVHATVYVLCCTGCEYVIIILHGAQSFRRSQAIKFPAVRGTRRFVNSFHKSPLLVPILSQINPVQALSSYF